MSVNVVPEQYLALQEKIVALQSEWQKKVQIDDSLPTNWPLKTDGIPHVTKIPFHIDLKLFQDWISQLAAAISEYDQRWQPDVERLLKVVGADPERWQQEAVACNTYYFQQVAEEEGVASWLPHFLAEHAIRPFLRELAHVYQEELAKIDQHVKGTGCPICGEPIRMAKMERLGRKALVCPRCEGEWHENRVVCSHCGNQNPKTMKYFTVEEEDTIQLHVCEECHGYLKVVDDRKRIKKTRPALLDVQTLHMDLVAQNRGYGVDPSDKKQEN
ncbi:formate dehydrogenase accessory protein FdhE [Rubeoparvulum massiliense]|uniref:formate dehydrogenase accessory protein FdhE n=1 Tax=Rubeoparvulum massiliense TaxID=1631346 RepID=UPI00065DC9FB|nr:formate dehydrogenase accessory protein FdhE [Rubeoparvulum massiliense]